MQHRAHRRLLKLILRLLVLKWKTLCTATYLGSVTAGNGMVLHFITQFICIHAVYKISLKDVPETVCRGGGQQQPFCPEGEGCLAGNMSWGWGVFSSSDIR